MIRYAFATSTCGQHFKVVSSTDKEKLFEKAKFGLPVKSWFDKYLQQALQSPQGFILLYNDDYEKEYFEMLLGECKAVKDYIKSQC